MLGFQRALGVYLFASVLLQTLGANAATYYVATTGDDNNPGTKAQPWKTVAYAVSLMVAGDTTYVHGGIYNEGAMRFRRSGTSTAPIKLMNALGETPIINCIDPAAFHRITLEHASGYQNPIGWITIEGFEIRNCYNGIKLYNAHDVTIRRNWIHHNPLGSGIVGNGTRVLIDRNIISSNALDDPTPPGGHGIYTTGTAFTITNNLIYDNFNQGITFNGSPSSFYNPTKHAGPEFALSHDWVIANNTFAYNRNRSGIVVWGSTCNNAKIDNNIFYENAVTLSNGSVQGIDFVSTTCTGIQIRNNLAFASGSGATAFLSSGAKEGVHYTQSGNIVNVSNPAFVNAPSTLPYSPNFALTSRSPAIDKGMLIAEGNTSLDGTIRPQGRAYDIGAYEYKADGDSQSPKAPSALQIR